MENYSEFRLLSVVLRTVAMFRQQLKQRDAQIEAIEKWKLEITTAMDNMNNNVERVAKIMEQLVVHMKGVEVNIKRLENASRERRNQFMVPKGWYPDLEKKYTWRELVDEKFEWKQKALDVLGATIEQESRLYVIVRSISGKWDLKYIYGPIRVMKFKEQPFFCQINDREGNFDWRVMFQYPGLTKKNWEKFLVPYTASKRHSDSKQ